MAAQVYNDLLKLTPSLMALKYMKDHPPTTPGCLYCAPRHAGLNSPIKRKAYLKLQDLHDYAIYPRYHASFLVHSRALLGYSPPSVLAAISESVMSRFVKTIYNNVSLSPNVCILFTAFILFRPNALYNLSSARIFLLISKYLLPHKIALSL